MLSCAIDSSQFERRSGDPVLSEPEASAPPAAQAEAQPLYQQLYQDEVGDDARPLGQRARMLAWMVGLSLTGPQLEELLAAHAALVALGERRTRDRAEQGQAELQHLGPVYEELVVALASDGALEGIDGRLAEARAALPDAQTEELARTREALDRAGLWLDTLNPPQRERVAEARYFLRRGLGPLVNPGDYEQIVGTRWMAGDFEALKTAEPSTEAMDLGGLWTAEAWRAHPDDLLGPLQQQAIALMALTEPGVDQAAEVLLKRREPLDFSPTPSPTPPEPSSPDNPR